MTKFGYVTCRVVGCTERGFNIETYPDYDLVSTYDEANRKGLKELGSDDFFIAEYENEICTAVYKYIDDKEERITDAEEVSTVNKALEGY